MLQIFGYLIDRNLSPTLLMSRTPKSWQKLKFFYDTDKKKQIAKMVKIRGNISF